MYKSTVNARRWVKNMSPSCTPAQILRQMLSTLMQCMPSVLDGLGVILFFDTVRSYRDIPLTIQRVVFPIHPSKSMPVVRQYLKWSGSTNQQSTRCSTCMIQVQRSRCFPCLSGRTPPWILAEMVGWRFTSVAMWES